MCSCAPGVLRQNSFSNVGVIAPNLVKYDHLNVVSSLAPKVFDLELPNLTGMLVTTCSCAPGVSRLDSFPYVGVTGLNIVKIWHFNVVSPVARKVFDTKLPNLTGMLVTMCSCAPGVLRLDLPSH